MTTYIVPPAARWSGRPLYSALVQFPVVCFIGALATDLAYWHTELSTWETFSIWLIAVGCVFAGLAGVVGLVLFVRDKGVRMEWLAWPRAIGSLLVAVLSVFNAFVHSRDGYTAVVPDGLLLSAVVVLLMLAVVAMRWYRPTSRVHAGVAA